MKNSYKTRSKEVKIIKKHMALSPYPNIEAATAANGGAYPPLSLIHI